MALKGVVSGNNYSFNAVSKTITFSSDYLGMSLSDVMYIINIKSGVATVIYDPSDVAKGGTLSGLTLTLNYDTSAMLDTDPLQIIIGFTPQNKDPQPVTIIESVESNTQTELLQSIADDLELLSLAMDQEENAPININDVTTKKDVQGANIASDAPRPIQFIIKGVLNDSLVVDTTGYSTLLVQGRTDVGYSSTLNVEGSNDGTAWFVLPLAVVSGTSTTGATFISPGSTVPGVSANITLYIPCFYRFVRLRTASTTGGFFSGTAYLRLWATNIGPLTTNGVTLSTLSTVVSSNTSTNGVSNISAMPIGGTFAPASTNVPWPVVIGGREAPYISALGGIVRPLLLDPLGRTVLGTDVPSGSFGNGSTMRGVGGIQNTMQSSQALLVSDVQQAEGDTNSQLLFRILDELKILNQQLIELPFLLNSGQSTMSDPEEYRNEHGRNW
tara:strand:+ start:4976 stop:6304 length:1329 start_codon:yes stop_codon:yes gene_type:complete